MPRSRREGGGSGESADISDDRIDARQCSSALNERAGELHGAGDCCDMSGGVTSTLAILGQSQESLLGKVSLKRREI